MHTPTPRSVIRWGTRTLGMAGPPALLILVGWAFRWDPVYARPQLAFMVYMLLLTVALSALLSVVLAYCHLAIHDAFAAGLRTGQASAGIPPSLPAPRGQDPVLRLVE